MNDHNQSHDLGSIGQRLRDIRHQQRRSQEYVAGGSFSKSYISAIERNKVRPSLKALGLIAERLETPLHELLGAEGTAEAELRIETFGNEFEYQLDQANWLIDTARAHEGLKLINEAAAAYDNYLLEFTPQSRYRFHLLRATAGLRVREVSAAQNDLGEAMSLAQQLANGAEEIERVRNLLGLSYYYLDLTHRALELHEVCHLAVRSGRVYNPELKLAILNNLANDYRALGNVERSAVIFNELLELSAARRGLQQHADLYWSLSLDYSGRANLDHARLYSVQALTVLALARNLTLTAQTTLELVEIALAKGELPAAERLLREASQTLPANSNGSIWSVLYKHHAMLALSCGKVDEAEEHARKGVTLASTAYAERAPFDCSSQSESSKNYADALCTLALVTEERGRPVESDQLLSTALRVLEHSRDRQTLGQTEYRYAEILRKRGEHHAAGEHYRRAYEHSQYGR